MLVVVGALVGPVRPDAVAAGGPDPAKACQKGFMDARAPVAATCAEGDLEPGTVTAALAAGFQESVVWSGLSNPTVLRFAADGRVFVAEKSGLIKVFDGLTDPTPTTYSGLPPNVHNYWDRGLLGLALDPSLTGGTGAGSYVYVLYAYDHILGSPSAPPRWGDQCPTPPGPTTDGCVVSGRLSRLNVSGTTITGPEVVLVEDWCQQFPSHSVGSLVFGPDGALYVSGGDGASFSGVDHGQLGGTTVPLVTDRNPCGDPPGGSMTPPTAEGGALRGQDVRTQPAGSSAYPDVVLADAPLAYFRMDEATGSALVDATGNHSGAYVGSPTLAQPGVAGTAVILDGGAGDYGEVSAWTTQPAAPASVEAWISHDGVKFTGVDTTIAGFVNAGTRALRLMAFTVDADTLELGLYTENGNAHYDWTPADTSWHHLVGTVDAAGTTVRVYLDGTQVASASVGYPGTGPTEPFRIGTGTDAGVEGTQSWPGGIDEVAVYGTTLSAAEVAAHYSAGISGGGPSEADPTSLDGAILRLNPTTGAGRSGNPFSGSADPNARRIIAYGLRNPFRMAFRPGTSELWVGDVGWSAWEEINRIPNATDGVAENFGWPCYEGGARQSGYDGSNLALCENLYAEGTGAVAPPSFSYRHRTALVAGETCLNGSSAVTGLAFYPQGGSFPSRFHGGLFFADHSRKCIWFLPAGTGGQPTSTPEVFLDPAANPVDLVVGPNGDLFYVDFNGSIRRIAATGTNIPPTAVLEASPTSGPAPLTVQFDATGSTDPEEGTLQYAWDLDGDGAYDDSTAASLAHAYEEAGTITVGLRVTDPEGASGTASQVINVGNSPPVPVISTPTAGTTWNVGTAITFSGSATDAQDGTLPASALTWSLVVQHCPATCHQHPIQSWSGVASGSFAAPDHEYPSYLELTLTATDAHGASASVTRRLDPNTAVLTFQSNPTGLSIAVNQTSSPTTFSRTVIVGSSNSVTATSPQTLNGSTWTFGSWSHGAAQSHQLVAPATNTTYTATYISSSLAFPASADAYVRSNQAARNFGTAAILLVRVSQSAAYLKFSVTGLSGAPSAARLRVWVTDGGPNGGSVFRASSNSWTETGITWSNAPPVTGSALASAGNVAAGRWVELDVTSAITGNGTYSFVISGGSSNPVEYASRETANVPVLVIVP